MTSKAYFGNFGGQYVPETAMFALIELEKEYEKAKKQAEKAQQKVAKDIEERKKRTEK